MKPEQLSKLGTTLSNWKLVKETNPRPLNGVLIDGLHSKGYTQVIDGETYSMGRFFLGEKELFRAWGLVEEEHCSYNSISLEDGTMTDVIEGCPDVTVSKTRKNNGILILKGDGKVMNHPITLTNEEKGMGQQTFLVKGLSCERCVVSLTKLLQEKFSDVSVTLSPPRLVLKNDESVSVDTINSFLTETKYSVQNVNFLHAVFFQIKRFLPLIIMLSLVVLFTTINVYLFGDHIHVHMVMQYFMAGYFLLFGGLKVANWKKFVASYRAYDPLAQKSKVYAQLYPAIEYGLGVLFYFGIALLYLNVFVAILMLQKAYGVHKKLKSGEVVQCACLGGYFSIPVTRVTLFEDLLMAGMALVMICI